MNFAAQEHASTMSQWTWLIIGSQNGFTDLLQSLHRIWKWCSIIGLLPSQSLPKDQSLEGPEVKTTEATDRYHMRPSNPRSSSTWRDTTQVKWTLLRDALAAKSTWFNGSLLMLVGAKFTSGCDQWINEPFAWQGTAPASYCSFSSHPSPPSTTRLVMSRSFWQVQSCVLRMGPGWLARQAFFLPQSDFTLHWPIL